MPIIVDGAQRRADVVREATALVIDGGVQNLSFRNLAKALGCSTTVISHYFHDKNDVLAETFRAAAAQAHARRDQVLAETDGDLLRAEEEMLPTTEDQRRRWIVWLSFWNAALFDRALGEEHRRGLAATRKRLQEHLAGRGFEPAEEAATAIADALYGIAVQALFYTAYWTAERQVVTFRRAVQAALGELP
jgi:AcrR family transcriptional regulator